MALIVLIGWAGGAAAQEAADDPRYGVVSFEPTVHRYYRGCGRSDVQHLDQVPDDALQETFDRWQADARALQALLEPDNDSARPEGWQIGEIDAAIRCAAITGECRSADFAQVVPRLLRSGGDPRCAPVAASPVASESLDDLTFGAAASRRGRPWWSWAGAGAGLAAGAVGVAWFAGSTQDLVASGEGVAAARARQDPSAYEAAASTRAARETAQVAAGSLGVVGITGACVAWNWRW